MNGTEARTSFAATKLLPAWAAWPSRMAGSGPVVSIAATTPGAFQAADLQLLLLIWSFGPWSRAS
jgi:hypothetical protein